MAITKPSNTFTRPFAESGSKNTIPANSLIGTTAGAASLADGFPPLTMTPLAAGGVPPSGKDMNGILNQISQHTAWMNAGGNYQFDRSIAAAGGYPVGAIIYSNDWSASYRNVLANNTTDFNATPSQIGVSWMPSAFLEKSLYPNVKSLGCVGDGLTDDTANLNAAISTCKSNALYLPAGQYKTTGLINPTGVQLVGPGQIIKNATQGGTFQVNSYSDTGKTFIGKEYLYRLYQRLKVGSTLKVFIYGDSTVATAANGGGYAGANGEPQNLLPLMLARKGITTAVNITNRGVGGTRVAQMNAVVDIDVVGATTDLFIIKYGINDAQDGLDGFATNLRAKLAEIRENPYGTVDNLSIVLVAPNAVYDPQHGRDSKWFEKIRGIYVEAARDYKCFYFDAYAYLRDVSWASTFLMDNPFGNGQGVHPAELMQTWIWGGCVDAMFGDSDLTLLFPDKSPLSVKKTDDKSITYNSNAIFTVPAGITKVYVSAMAAGGGGGGGGGSSTTNVGSGGGGGGAGQSCIEYKYVVTPSSTLTINIGGGGAGGAASLSAGNAGLSGGNTTIAELGLTLVGGAGGAGGQTSTGTANGGAGGSGAPTGGSGSDSSAINLSYGSGGGGHGAASQLGGGGGSVRGTEASGDNGKVGAGYGSGGGGGGGAIKKTVSGAYNGGSGGNGTSGFVLIRL